jgi:hypothetical protein
MPACSRTAVVVLADGDELALEVARVGEPREVGPVVLEVPEEALDRRLVGRDAGPAEVGGDGVQGHADPAAPDADQPVLLAVSDLDR